MRCALHCLSGIDLHAWIGEKCVWHYIYGIMCMICTPGMALPMRAYFSLQAADLEFEIVASD